MKTHDIWISAHHFIERYGKEAINEAWSYVRNANSKGDIETAKGWKRVVEIIQVLENENQGP